jgi:hypothetical protein
LHINKIFLGGMTFPYQDYALTNVDINELYDFNRGLSKITSTSVMGHKVAESYEMAKGNDLVTIEMLGRILQQCMCNTPGTSGTSGTSGNPV